MRTNESPISSTNTGNRFMPPFRSAWRDTPASASSNGYAVRIFRLALSISPHPFCLLVGRGAFGGLLLRDLHRRVPEEYRDLIHGNSGEQHLDRKCVADHVGMATLQLAIEPSDISQLEETTIGSLPVSHDRFGGSIAAPEEIAWVRPGTIGDIHQCIDNMGGKRHIDRLPGLGLIEQEAVAMQTVPFKRHRIADAEPAPAHQ